MSVFTCISLADGQEVSPPDACVLCLGNFDGVHLAHQALLKKAVQLRNEHFSSAACGVFCFSSLSSDHLLATPPPHLSTTEQKAELFASCGMEYLFLADFSAVRNRSPEDFVEQILLGGCHCAVAVCGFNYKFGKGGVGTPDLLQKLLNAPVWVQEEVKKDGKTVSSTEIRRLLLDGQAEEAAKLLTRPYSFTSEVIHGKALGQTIGVPTINQDFPKGMLIPRHGVYITDCEINGVHYRGVSNVGSHPTVDNGAHVNCETHLLDFRSTVYGREVTVSFLKFLRPEKKFDSLESLCLQLQDDIRVAKEY
ncbi:MAG: bifunctional riboflavin kinase/FAD synthetase [Clostridia bacterium]|nr:bifunctional riboflavin kinase/FAD synthetase [Clostridia bacterium]